MYERRNEITQDLEILEMLIVMYLSMWTIPFSSPLMVSPICHAPTLQCSYVFRSSFEILWSFLDKNYMPSCALTVGIKVHWFWLLRLGTFLIVNSTQPARKISRLRCCFSFVGMFSWQWTALLSCLLNISPPLLNTHIHTHALSHTQTHTRTRIRLMWTQLSSIVNR